MQAAVGLAPPSSSGLGWQPTDRHGDFFFFLDDSKHSQADGRDGLGVVHRDRTPQLSLSLCYKPLRLACWGLRTSLEHRPLRGRPARGAK